MFLTNITKWILFLSLALPGLTIAAENPDELYRQGRYAEAEQAYAQYDMDHPKDIRYRYNRGCATYRNSDYEGAMAAFASVLRRAKDDRMRFKAAYNSGNTAFKQGDFESAVAHYKQAIIYNPENEDARHNLELALIALAKSKKDESEKPTSQHQKNEEGQSDKKEDGKAQPPAKKDADREQSQTQNQQQSADQREPERQAGSKPDKEGDPDEGQKAELQPTKNFSGEPESPQALPHDQQGDNTGDSANPAIDKKMAEALLDNIKEDRSRFLRFQIPREKRHGVQSGKDW